MPKICEKNESSSKDKVRLLGKQIWLLYVGYRWHSSLGQFGTIQDIAPTPNMFLLWGRLEARSTVNICHLHLKLNSYPGGGPEKPGGGGGNPGGKPAGGLKPGGGPGIPGGANGIGGRARGIWPTISSKLRFSRLSRWNLDKRWAYWMVSSLGQPACLDQDRLGASKNKSAADQCLYWVQSRTALAFLSSSTTGGGPSTLILTTVSPRKITKPRVRFISCSGAVSSPAFFFGLTLRNSSQSANTKFMWRSKASIWPVNARPSLIVTLSRQLIRESIFPPLDFGGG